MATLPHVLAGLLLAAGAMSCHPTQKERPVIPRARTTFEPKAPPAKSSILLHSGKKSRSKCAVDEAVIIADRNLPPLLAELEKTALVPCQTTSAIPPAIRRLLECREGGTFAMANPGEDWQVSDVVITGPGAKKLLPRQLAFLGVSDPLVLLAYYTGGIGKSAHILIFKRHQQTITDFWYGDALADLTSQQEIVSFLKQQQASKRQLDSGELAR